MLSQVNPTIIPLLLKIQFLILQTSKSQKKCFSSCDYPTRIFLSICSFSVCATCRSSLTLWFHYCCTVGKAHVYKARDSTLLTKGVRNIINSRKFLVQNKRRWKYINISITPPNIRGIVIQKNQLDATIIYWSIRSAQHVPGNLLPIIRSVRLRFLQHMVTCCCGG